MFSQFFFSFHQCGLRTIVTVQGFIETIFSILEDEDLTAGGKVARDLLQCLINVVGTLVLTTRIYLLTSSTIAPERL